MTVLANDFEQKLNHKKIEMRNYLSESVEA